jgi:hypothetical protein
MITSTRVAVAALFLAFLVVSPAWAATYIVPPDAEMIQRSDDIVVATAIGARTELDERGAIVTRYVLRVEESLKGDFACGDHLTVTEQGGILDGKARLIGGAPEYRPGSRYLVFTETGPTLEPATFGMALGQFFFTGEGREVLAVRSGISGFDQNLNAYTERPRNAERFQTYIRDVVAQRPSDATSYFVSASRQVAAESAVTLAEFSRGSYLMGGNFRWQDAPGANFVLSAKPTTTIPAAGAASVSTAVSEWNSTESSIAYGVGAEDLTAQAGLTANDGKDAVLFNASSEEVQGAAAIGGAFGNFQYNLDGESFINIFEADVVVGIGLTSCFGSIMTHEMGHTLGFRHSDAGSVPAGKTCGSTANCTSNAIMTPVLSQSLCGRNGALLQYDSDAASTVYGAGPVCTAPSITTQPLTKSVAQNTSTTLTVVAAGTGPFTFQWFIGESGNTTQSTGTNSSTLNVNTSTVGATSYWVRVTNSCPGSVDSNTATVTVTAPVCNPPSITAQPQNRNITLGSSTTLTVGAGGSSPFSFQWFIGEPGNTSQPTGTNNATITVSPSVTTTYWARVTNACSTQVADSAAATVTVTCNPPAITSQPASPTITEGGSTTLQVGASGSGLSFQWFIGPTGNTGQPTGGNSASLGVNPSVTTQYWVRVSGACGPAVDSNTATVTVIPCADVEIDAPTSTPNPGTGNFRLNVTAFSSAGPLTFTWFRGNTPGVLGTQVGTGQAINVTGITAATSFWVRVTNGCGKVAFSSLITVAPCTLPSISTQPQDQTIATNTNATLTIALTGTGNTVKWYRGTVGDRTAEVGTGLSVSPGPLFETTKFWAEVTNSCGAVSSRQVTVTVEQATSNLFLLNRRFNVQVRYRNQFANPPTEGLLIGRSLLASPLADTAIFWFDSPLVVELMVRISDARPFDNHYHIYYGGLSDVEFFITVTDTQTGRSEEYHKEANQLVGDVDRVSFPTEGGTSVLQSGVDALMTRASSPMLGANADTSTLRMLSRYDVRIRYRNQFASPVEEGFLLGRSIAALPTTDTAVFYFNNPENVEWIVRFSDVRPFANRIDFFHGGLSDVEFTVEVTDTITGTQREYRVEPFSLKGGVDRESYRP